MASTTTDSGKKIQVSSQLMRSGGGGGGLLSAGKRQKEMRPSEKMSGHVRRGLQGAAGSRVNAALPGKIALADVTRGQSSCRWPTGLNKRLVSLEEEAGEDSEEKKQEEKEEAEEGGGCLRW